MKTLAHNATARNTLRQPNFRSAGMTGQIGGEQSVAQEGNRGRVTGSQAAFFLAMNNAGHLPISETARRVGKTKSKRGRPRKNHTAQVAEKELPAAGTLTRTKSLLLAALRVWELKHRITD